MYPYSSYDYSYPTYRYPQGCVTPRQATFSRPIEGHMLGIDEAAINDSGVIGMEVTQVYVGSPAERAGLQSAM